MEITVTKENFGQEVLQADKTVLVDFFATWCGPCRMVAPIVKQIAEEGKAKVCKIDVDEQPELAIRFGVDSIPTLLVFKGGELTDRAVGFRTKEQLEALL
ncbi:MAG: thioredoxin [Oscillospiraceae bacterium]|nr:thioredoxin [Oscillospiraceae bacterium]